MAYPMARRTRTSSSFGDVVWKPRYIVDMPAARRVSKRGSSWNSGSSRGGIEAMARSPCPASIRNARVLSSRMTTNRRLG